MRNQLRTFTSEAGNATQTSSSAAYSSPLDSIVYTEYRYCLDREKLKFEKAAKTYDTFVHQTEKEREELQAKMTLKAERDQRKLAEMKKEQEDKQAKFERIKKKREKIRAQKQSLDLSHFKEMMTLDKSMREKVSSSTQRRRFGASAYSFDKKSLDGASRAQTASMSPAHAQGNANPDLEVDAQLRKIEERLGNHARRLEESRQEKTRKTRDHIEKVTFRQIDRTCELVLKTRAEQEEEMLRKAVEKGVTIVSRRVSALFRTQNSPSSRP